MDRFSNLEKIEFVVTNECGGRCIHCSQGKHNGARVRLDAGIAAKAVYDLCSQFSIKTVMTFGGEPMHNPEAVYAVQSAARDCRVQRRQVITNGHFTKDKKAITKAARRLYECGVNDLLLSVDAFHAQWADMDIVKAFAGAAVSEGVPIRVQPAWLVSKDDKNEYNIKTERLIKEFESLLGIKSNEGNVIFPEGNALLYLGGYFKAGAPENPYVQDENDIRCISVCENGDLLCGNLYSDGILDIISRSRL